MAGLPSVYDMDKVPIKQITGQGNSSHDYGYFAQQCLNHSH